MLQHSKSSINSPCNGFCKLDKLSEFCLGCFRNINEIINWQILTDKEKAEVINNLETRKKKLNLI